METGWYVLRTESRAEYLSAAELEKDGFEVFFPRVTTVHPRIGHLDTPLFPGYLFLHVGLDSTRLPRFRSGHRVAGWVNFDGEVPLIPDEVIAELTQRVDAINGTNGLWRRFLPGEKVNVVCKSIESLAEVIEEAKSPRSQAKVLLEFMGRLVEAQVPWEYLRPVGSQPLEKPKLPRRTRGRNRWIRGFAPALTPTV